MTVLTTRFFPNRNHIILAVIIAAYAIIVVHLSFSIPLGEAPDEPAQFQYISYIAENRALPTAQEERTAAGYRSDKSPLYHVGAAALAQLFRTGGVQSLKNIGDNPHRILPTDGNPPYSILHTDDELPPYTGIVRSWHAARFASLLWGVLALLMLYTLLRRIFPATGALAGTALAAAMPRYLQMSAVLNEDTLLAFLVLLYLNLLLPLFRRRGSWQRYAALGLVAGLALTAKYSALFLSLDVVLLWLLLRRIPTLHQLGAYFGGMLIGAGWWFGFVIANFNRIDSLGWLKGALAPFLLGGRDAASHQVAASLGIGGTGEIAASLFALNWLEWARQFFISLWFAGGDVPLGWWLPLAIVSAVAGGWGAVQFFRNRLPRRMLLFTVGHLLLFMPLPLLRYALTQNIPETAQGRHVLFPAIFSLMAIFLFAIFPKKKSPEHAGKRILPIGVMVIFLLVAYTQVDFPRITLANTPLLPVRTAADFPSPAVPLGKTIAGQRLVGVDFPSPGREKSVFPVTLRWRVEAVAEKDFRTRVTLFDDGGNFVGQWLGMPVNGRYPTRAWEMGDTIFHTIPVPVLSGAVPASARVDVLATDGAAIATVEFPVPLVATTTEAMEIALLPRGDRLPVAAPYRYRSTIALRVAESNATVTLQTPNGDEISPVVTFGGEKETFALFWVDWTWPSGAYALWVKSANGASRTVAEFVSVQTNRRLTELPAVSRPLNANFAGRFLLAGYDLSARTADPGGLFEVTLVWQSLVETNGDFAVFNHLLNAENQTQFGGEDRIPQKYYRTLLWQKGEVVIDRYAVPIRADAPPGMYWLDVGVYPAGNAAAAPLPLVENGKSLPQNSVRLGPVKVGGQPARSIPPTQPAQVTDIRFGDVIRLAGYTIEPENDTLQLQLFWDTLATPDADYTVFVHVLDAAGAVVAQNDAPPVNGLYPTGFWAAGEIIFDPHAVSLADVPAGSYMIRMGWYNPQTGARLPVAGNPEGAVILTQFSHE